MKRAIVKFPPGIVTFLRRLDELMGKFEAFVLSAGILLLAINMVANVLGRVFFHHSFYFAEEVGSILMILITFIGIGYAARQGRHIRMSAIIDQLSRPAQKAIRLFVTLTTGLTMFLLAYYAVGYIAVVARLGSVTPALQIPVWLIYLWIPVGFTVTGIQYLLAFIQNLRKPEVYLSFTKEDRYEKPEPGEEPI